MTHAAAIARANDRHARARALGALMTAVALAACGGGDPPAAPAAGPPAPAPAPPPAPAPGGTAGQCYDLALNETPGTNINVSYTYGGPVTGNQTVDATVGVLTTFEGQSAVENAVKTTGSNTVAGITTAIDTNGKYYSRRTAAAEVTVYGLVLTTTLQVAGFTVPTESKSVWSPPWVDRRFSLAQGALLTQTYSGSTTSTIGGIAGAPPTVTVTPATVSSTTKFVGVESVTVPAGTYSACKFEDYAVATPTEITTSWLIVGKGILVKSLANTGSGTQTIEATAVKLNGAAL